jgi:hypothetical protein
MSHRPPQRPRISVDQLIRLPALPQLPLGDLHPQITGDTIPHSSTASAASCNPT